MGKLVSREAMERTPIRAATQGAQTNGVSDAFVFAIGDDVRFIGSGFYQMFRVEAREERQPGTRIYQVNCGWALEQELTLVLPVDEASAARHHAAGRTWPSDDSESVQSTANSRSAAYAAYIARKMRNTLNPPVEGIPADEVHTLHPSKVCALPWCAKPKERSSEAGAHCSKRCALFNGARVTAEVHLDSFVDRQHHPERAWAEAKTAADIAALKKRFDEGFLLPVEKA